MNNMNNMNNMNSNWYLLYCKGREEQRAVDNLKNQNIESFFVSHSIEKIVRGKKTMKEEPLFPNYVFAKLCSENDNFNSVRSTRGVLNFVKCGIEYIKVPTLLITNLKNYHETVVSQKLNAGDKLTIKNGPFKGLNAIYQCSNGLERSIILVNILNNQNEVKISNKDIRVIND